MSGKSSQAKGRRGEIELAHLLQRYGYPVEVGRAQSYGEVPDLSGLPGVHIECKGCEQARLSEWMQQATWDSEKFHDGAPTLFHRRYLARFLRYRQKHADRQMADMLRLLKILK